MNLRDAWKSKLGMVGNAYGTLRANALPMNGEWQVFLSLSDYSYRTYTVKAADPEAAIKAGWENVRKEREEAGKRKRRV